MQQAAEDAAGRVHGVRGELVAKRRADPDGRLLSRLATVTEGGAGLSDHEIVCTLISLLNAGHEATVNTLGNGMRALLRHPDEWASLVSGRVDAAVAVEELIRWDAPLQLFNRFVLEEGVVLGGQSLPVGAVVAVLLGSANRDPRRFPNPDHFDLGRGDQTHVGFGGGIHFCVGAPAGPAGTGGCAGRAGPGDAPAHPGRRTPLEADLRAARPPRTPGSPKPLTVAR